MTFIKCYWQPDWTMDDRLSQERSNPAAVDEYNVPKLLKFKVTKPTWISNITHRDILKSIRNLLISFETTKLNFIDNDAGWCWSWENFNRSSFCWWRLPKQLHTYNRYRFPGKNNRVRGSTNQVADLGYCWPRSVSSVI